MIRNFIKHKLRGVLLESDNGSIIRLYHGTHVEFDEFNKEKLFTGEGATLQGVGFYFTAIREVAETYAHLNTKTEINNFTLNNQSLGEYENLITWIVHRIGRSFNDKLIDDKENVIEQLKISIIYDNFNFSNHKEEFLKPYKELQTILKDKPNFLDSLDYNVNRNGFIINVDVKNGPFIDYDGYDKFLYDIAIKKFGKKEYDDFFVNWSSSNSNTAILNFLGHKLDSSYGSRKGVVEDFLSDLGVVGVKFELRGTGANNYVIFDVNDIKIVGIEKNV